MTDEMSAEEMAWTVVGIEDWWDGGPDIDLGKLRGLVTEAIRSAERAAENRGIEKACSVMEGAADSYRRSPECIEVVANSFVNVAAILRQLKSPED